MNLEVDMTKVTVEVELDLTELGDDEMVSELESRGYEVSSDFEADHPSVNLDLMSKIHQHLAMGQEQDALEILRPYLRDILGKAL
ncbi:hypothetical protein ACOTEN_30165 [Achromobacter xylosoxidans]